MAAVGTRRRVSLTEPLTVTGGAVPETRYARSGDVHIAYQVMGEGPGDLVYIPGWVSHLELEMEMGLPRRFYETLASFTRLIRFDKRGTGMSDRVSVLGGFIPERFSGYVSVPVSVPTILTSTRSHFGNASGARERRSRSAGDSESVTRVQ